MFKIAETVGKTVGELEELLTVDEFVGWGAWFELKYEAEKKAYEKAKRKR